MKSGLIFQKLTNPKKRTKHPNTVLSAVETSTILFTYGLHTVNRTPAKIVLPYFNANVSKSIYFHK